MEFIKKNISLIVGIAIPFFMILFVAGSVYLPALLTPPKHNFIYASGNDEMYISQYRYSVQNGKLVRTEVQKADAPTYPPDESVNLYFYDIKQEKSKEITFEEAQTFNLDPSSKSPDGFEIVGASRDGGFIPFLFWPDRDFGTRYLKGHNISKDLKLNLSGSYQSNFRLIGWIK